MKENVVRISDLERELNHVDKCNLNLDIIIELANKHSFSIECGDMFAEVCSCYDNRLDKRITHYDYLTGRPIYEEVVIHRCTGTKEQEECYCGGDKRCCTFYPEYRK